MVAIQGEVYWIDLGEPLGSEPGYLRPHLVVQNDVLNISAIRTVVMCGITTNLRMANMPGNVLLNAGEANLPETSVVNVTQLITADKDELIEKVGQISEERYGQVFEGLILTISPRRFSHQPTEK